MTWFKQNLMLDWLVKIQSPITMYVMSANETSTPQHELCMRFIFTFVFTDYT